LRLLCALLEHAQAESWQVLKHGLIVAAAASFFFRAGKRAGTVIVFVTSVSGGPYSSRRDEIAFSCLLA
jgi:hypothetical protein